MRTCWSCNKEQEDSYFTRDRVACNDCTISTEDTFELNKEIASIAFGVKL